MTLSIIDWQILETPFGPISLAWQAAGLVALNFGDDPSYMRAHVERHKLGTLAKEPCATGPYEEPFQQYFSGALNALDQVKVAPIGTEFNMSVWKALQAIPAGQTRTYGALAKDLGRPGAARAVGLACNRNPIAIAIPCHRVVGSTGKLTGFAGGLDVKAWLLDHEGVATQDAQYRLI
ncbi:MAG: methylated-DNA--[protein]-cysteine S-methyltransferase [Alphaproteobacteria bacterium]|nr:MAG: methylated-DNA--[protein]-cysteine S-methyltransferase [Alphaproteobacteria bacterium]